MSLTYIKKSTNRRPIALLEPARLINEAQTLLTNWGESRIEQSESGQALRNSEHIVLDNFLNVNKVFKEFLTLGACSSESAGY